MSASLSIWPGVLVRRNTLVSSSAKEQFNLCTRTLSTLPSVGRHSFADTNVKVVPLSRARFCITSAGPGSWVTEKAGAPGLNIPALCQAIVSMVGPSCATWSIPRDVIPVTTRFRITFVASYSPPWWTSNIAASTSSLMKVWKANRARNCRYQGCFATPASSSISAGIMRSHTSKKYRVNNSSATGWSSICIRSRTHCKCGPV